MWGDFVSITSLVYLLFVFAVTVVYFCLPKKVQWVWLLIASTVFYFVQGWELSLWLYVSALTIYVCGLALESEEKRCREAVGALDKSAREEKKLLKQKSQRKKRIILLATAVFNIGIWVVFKFTDLFLITLNNAFSTNLRLFNLVLPLGISFYTFMAVSYVVDIYRGKIAAQHNPLKLTLWLSFFPQMIQGPICRYSETADQLFEGHRPEQRRIKFGLQLMLWGYFKKLVIADRIADITSTVFSDTSAYPGSILLIGLLAFTIQLYGDFSGGIDVIRGVAQILGIDMPVNFERPYFSKSVPEYWRRWHKSLGAWFREYIFYPLSISKPAQALGKRTRKWFGPQFGKMAPTYVVMLIVWMMNGIWHGAGMQYLVYGLYQGTLIVLGMSSEPFFAKWLKRFNVNTDCFSWRLFQMLRTSMLMLCGRVFIKSSSLSEAFYIIKKVFTHFGPMALIDGTVFKLGLNTTQMFILGVAALVLLGVSTMQECGIKLRETIEKQNLVFRWLLYLAALFAVILFGVYGPGYNAADFIYANF